MKNLSVTAALLAGSVLACGAPPPDASIDTQWQDRVIAVANGDSMHLVHRAIGRPQVLVFIPGLADTWASYQKLAAALPDSFGFVLVDALGHGSSTKRPGTIGPERQADALGHALDSIGVRPFAIIGHSYGGVIAQHYAGAHPELPAVVLMATMSTLRGIASADAYAELARTIPDTVPDEILAGQRDSFFGPVEDSVVEPYITAARATPGHAWREILTALLQGDTQRFLTDWKPQTLVVMAQQDKLLDSAATMALVRALPQADTVTIPRTSHAMHWERPDTVGIVLSAFLSRVSR